MKLRFEAEIVETKQVKRSLDNIFSVKFVTDDSSILTLGALPSDRTVSVTVDVDEIHTKM